MHPDEFPGAASVAYSHAKYLSSRFSVAFWHTTLLPSGITNDERLQVRAFHLSSFVDKFIRRHNSVRLLNEFSAPSLFFRLTLLLIRERPKLVWMNQIGVRIPRTISLVLFLLRIKVIQTFHDFGVISPRKLYPQNISTDGEIKLSKIKFLNYIYFLRRLMTVAFTHQNFKNICISELQANIYGEAGVKNVEIVANGIGHCECSGKVTSIKKRNEVLFAGRSTGKGFEQICRIVKNNPDWKLLAAGQIDLATSAREFLTPAQFEYLGFLKPIEIFNCIHRVKFVSVLSECFDVYPTIGLEGLMHNSKILATNTTGIARFLTMHGGGVLVDASDTSIDLTSLFEACIDINEDSTALISIENSTLAYESIFRMAMQPTL